MRRWIVFVCSTIALFSSMGANYRTQNFLISAPTPQLAREIGDAAEAYRRSLAIEWIGRELPPWSQPCPVEAQVASHLGAGGETSFMFRQRTPFGWTMRVQGSRERVLDSVLPHEITHTIFATHFGRPLPRWADEGACTTVEHESERHKQERFLIEFLTTNRGIAFNKMFAMTEYPSDILPLYSQGYALARFLIQQGGKPKFVQYVGEGMERGNWTAATYKYYGYESLGELQTTWLEWVQRGTPLPLPSDLVKNQAPPTAPADPALLVAANSKAGPIAGAVTVPGNPAPFANEDSTSVGRVESEGWYEKIRDDVLAGHPAPTDLTHAQDANPLRDASVALASSPAMVPVDPTAGMKTLPPSSAILPTEQAVSTTNNPYRDNPFGRPEGKREVLLEWRRSEQEPAVASRGEREDLSRLEVPETNSVFRR